MLFVLLALTVMTGVAAAFGVIAWWCVAIPLCSVVLFLCVARRQVRLADERFWAEAARARPESSNVLRRSAASVGSPRGASRDAADDEPTVVLPVSALALQDERVTAVPLVTADGGSLWDPVVISLPTYVEKADAKRTIRTVDLGAGDTWSTEKSAAASRSTADAAQAVRQAQLRAGQAELQVDVPRAANG